jgi:tRNA (adenine37-N6)-methyltransferase
VSSIRPLKIIFAGMKIQFNPIGIIHTPFESKEGMPIQPAGAAGIKGKIVLNHDLVDGLLDLDGFSHIYLIYYFHQSAGFELQVTPFLDDNEHGIFATRAPRRPNQIGISVVKLLSVTGNTIEIENVDVLNGTPLLDIKPYIPVFDSTENAKCGWMEKTLEAVQKFKSDNRFEINSVSGNEPVKK